MDGHLAVLSESAQSKITVIIPTYLSHHIRFDVLFFVESCPLAGRTRLLQIRRRPKAKMTTSATALITPAIMIPTSDFRVPIVLLGDLRLILRGEKGYQKNPQHSFFPDQCQ